jgi:hypothetical protein
LRKTLFDLNLHTEMMEILRRKYFPQVESTEEASVTVDQHLKDLSLQGEITELVRACLRSSGRSANKTKVRTFVENPKWKSKNEINKENYADRISQEDQGRVTADSQMLSDSTNVTSLLVDRADTPKDDVTNSQGIQNYIHGLITEDELSEEEILKIFGVNETQFKNKLKPIIKNILQLFFYLNTGQTLKNEHNFKELNGLLRSEGIQEIWHNNELSLGAILKLLTLIMEHLHSNKFFLKASIIQLPYVSNSKQHFNLNYNSEERNFQLISRDHIEINSFCSIRFEFEWKLIIEQILYFVVSEDFELYLNH